jgi:hypothetical protein
MEDVGIFHGHLVYFTPVLENFIRFGMLYQKSGNPTCACSKENWVVHAWDLFVIIHHFYETFNT